jgi:hypothetical protein
MFGLINRNAPSEMIAWLDDWVSNISDHPPQLQK